MIQENMPYHLHCRTPLTVKNPMIRPLSLISIASLQNLQYLRLYIIDVNLSNIHTLGNKTAEILAKLEDNQAIAYHQDGILTSLTMNYTKIRTMFLNLLPQSFLRLANLEDHARKLRRK